jgi:hypothetical protein
MDRREERTSWIVPRPDYVAEAEPGSSICWKSPTRTDIVREQQRKKFYGRTVVEERRSWEDARAGTAGT